MRNSSDVDLAFIFILIKKTTKTLWGVGGRYEFVEAGLGMEMLELVAMAARFEQ